mgnify:CR=1 FL=1
MKNHLSFWAVALLSLWACSHDELQPAVTPAQEPQRILSFHATSEPQTRATLDADDSGIFRWQEGDRIGIFTSSVTPLDLQSGSGTTDATFQGSVSGTPAAIAVFPYNAAHSLKSNKVSFYLPDTYTYQEGRTNVAMAATGVSFDGDVMTGSFKHLAGLLQFTVSGVPESARYFQFIAENRKITGTFTFSAASSEPEITTAEQKNENYVEIAFAQADVASTMTFYVPVPTGNYSGFSVRLLNASKNIIAERKASKALSVARADIVRMPVTMKTVDPSQVLVTAVTKRSFVYVKDGVAQYVYQGTSGAGVSVGDLITISGGTSSTYNGMAQLQNATTTVQSSNHSVQYPSPKDITDEFDSYTNTEMEFITVTGTISIATSGSNTYYNFTVDGASKTGSVTYPVDDLGLADLNGTKVRLTGYYQGLNNNKYQYIVAISTEEAFDTDEPTLVTGSYSQRTMTSATLTAKYVNIPLSPYAPQDVRFVYGTSADNLSETAWYNDGISSESGSYSVKLTSLEPATTYYYKAVMSIYDETSGTYVDLEGDILSFSTRSDASGQNAGLQYLVCNEIPYVDLADPSGYTDSDLENWGTTSWFRYQTTNADQHVITHTYVNSAQKQVRNYTVLYDTDKYCPIWVAQTFNSGMYPNNSIGRQGSWGFDPALSSDSQSTGSITSYDRGHLCASADRQDVLYANYETFYYTNQAPQWASFNQGIWVTDLEAKIQKMTVSGTDSLYVVSGTLFENNVRKTSGNGKSVLLPSHFYKCILLGSFNSRGEMTSAKGIAYLFTNEDHSAESIDSFITTIDAIEQRSGFDFFCNVSEEFQDDAESVATKLW